MYGTGIYRRVTLPKVEAVMNKLCWLLGLVLLSGCRLFEDNTFRHDVEIETRADGVLSDGLPVRPTVNPVTAGLTVKGSMFLGGCNQATGMARRGRDQLVIVISTKGAEGTLNCPDLLRNVAYTATVRTLPPGEYTLTVEITDDYPTAASWQMPISIRD